MALFNKEPEKGPKIQPVQPSSTSNSQPQPSASASGQQSSLASRPAPALAGESLAHLDRGTKVSGKLSFDGPARIDGEVDGEITSKDSLNIGETAVVTAQIRAASVVVAGKVSGDITGSQKIEIRPSAKVVGNLAAPLLSIHEGAQFEGHCSMQPEAAREDRKVTVFPKEDRITPASHATAPGGGPKPA
jgi:cytoskeletal protein CcmA (bactofilin family)